MSIKKIETEADRIVAEELETARQHIIENHVAAEQRVTGATAGSITITVSDNGSGGVIGSIDARAYFGAIETGSGPWKKQYQRTRKDGTEYPSAPKWFVDIIKQWALDKGAALESPWGVATNQMRFGTKLFRNGGREDIFSNEIPLLLDRIADRLAGLFDAQIVDQF